jgi:hypothetical protein
MHSAQAHARTQRGLLRHLLTFPWVTHTDAGRAGVHSVQARLSTPPRLRAASAPGSSHPLPLSSRHVTQLSQEVEEILQSVIAQTHAELEDARAEARRATAELDAQRRRQQERDAMTEVRVFLLVIGPEADVRQEALGIHMNDVTELTMQIDALEEALGARDAEIRDLQRRQDAPGPGPAWSTYRAAPATPIFVHPSARYIPQAITEGDIGWVSDGPGPDVSSGLCSDDEWSDLYADPSTDDHSGMSDVGTPERASSPPLSVSSEVGERVELADSFADNDDDNGA